MKVVIDALLDLLSRIGLAAPAGNLRPAGDAGFDPMTGEVTVDHLVIEPVRRLRLDSVRPRPNQREIAFEDDVEELRQLVEAGLADETADTGNARVAFGHEFGGVRVSHVSIHRAELVDLDVYSHD